MSRHASLLVGVALAGVGLLLASCGEKIAIPHAQGLFSVSAYLPDSEYEDTEARQLAEALGAIFVITESTLTKRDLEYNVVATATGLGDARAVCLGPQKHIVYVWDQSTHNLNWYRATDLELMGTANLPTVQSVTALATDMSGIEQVPGARTFIYLTDPVAAVVHRFAFDDFNGLSVHGILTRANGEGARFVHEAAGMATDAEGKMLVCEADPQRNWIIRFDGTPDLLDTTPSATDQDPLRGKAYPFEITCEPPAATDFVLGDAAICGQTDWVGAPSREAGSFSGPLAVTVDGSGRIFVADTGNDRVQIFSPAGIYELEFGSDESCPGPISLGLVDVRVGTGVNDINFGAYVFVVLPEIGQVRKFISSEHYIYIHREPPPPPR